MESYERHSSDFLAISLSIRYFPGAEEIRFFISVFELNISVKQFISDIGISEINCSGLFIGSILIIFFETGVDVGTEVDVAMGVDDVNTVSVAFGISDIDEIGDFASEFLHEAINTIEHITNIFIKYLKYKLNPLDLYRTSVL